MRQARRGSTHRRPAVHVRRGLRQKAAIALAFVRPFELLLVDEPFVGLDLTGRTALLELLDRANRRGAAIVVATHELGTVAAADRLVALPRRSGGIRRATGRRRRRHPGHEMKGQVVIVAPMYEFDSVSVSTFEASTLTAKLTEKSSDGWDVVAVVPTGNDITAFLRRATAGSSTSTGSLESDVGATTVAAVAASEPAGWANAPESAAASNSSGWSEQGSSWGGAERDTRRRHVVGLGQSDARRACAGSNDACGAGRLVRRSGTSLRAALLGRVGVDRARLARRSAVHRSTGRVIAGRAVTWARLATKLLASPTPAVI